MPTIKDGSFIIATDTTSDLPREYLQEHGIPFVGLTYTIKDTNYDEASDANLPPKQFYDLLRAQEFAKTSQVTPESYVEFFKQMLNTGKDVLYIGFSSGLSGSLQSAHIAKSELVDEYPNQKIYIIDSLCASLGQGLLVDFAVTLRGQGNSIDEVYQSTQAQVLHVCHYFTVDDLNHLYRGGRVSKVAAMVGTLLGIKPVMHVNDEGKLVAYGKVRGRKASLDALVAKAGEKGANIPNEYVFISHGDCLADAEYVACELNKKHMLQTKIINFVGPVIGAHSGPGTVALFFMGGSRSEQEL